MGIDGCVSAVYEEAQLAKPAASADKLVNISVSRGISGTLESKVCQMPVKGSFHRACKRLDSLEVLKTYRVACAKLFGEVQSHLVSVNRRDVFNSQRAEHCDTNQSDGAASLYHHAAVEAEDSRCLCSLNRMHQNGAGLNQDSGIQIQIAYVKYGGTAAD